MSQSVVLMTLKFDCLLLTVDKRLKEQQLLLIEFLNKISNLLEDGLNAVNVLTLVKTFPQQILGLFTYSGEIRNEEVLQALYVNEDEDLDSVTLEFLYRYICNLSKEGMHTIVK